MYLPQELWDTVHNHVLSISAVNASKVFDSRLENGLEEHAGLWSTIFKNETWLYLVMTKFRLNPVLVGVKPAYMVLVARDYSGNLRYERNLFLSSLQEYTPIGALMNYNSDVALSYT
jgi:hypothetical protein